MFQEAWGHCLASHTAGPNCPEGTFPGTEYDFYAVNGGQGISVKIKFEIYGQNNNFKIRTVDLPFFNAFLIVRGKTV